EFEAASPPDARGLFASRAFHPVDRRCNQAPAKHFHFPKQARGGPPNPATGCRSHDACAPPVVWRRSSAAKKRGAGPGQSSRPRNTAASQNASPLQKESLTRGRVELSSKM